MLIVNCDGHLLLGRLHKPDPKLPDDAQDKPSLVPLEPEQWDTWLHGSENEAPALLVAPPAEWFDSELAASTDAILSAQR